MVTSMLESCKQDKNAKFRGNMKKYLLEKLNMMLIDSDTNQLHPSYVRFIVIIWKESICLGSEQILETIKPPKNIIIINESEPQNLKN
jgi:hypothetical protein